MDQTDCPMKIGTDSVLLGSWVAVDSAKRILDIGTGTGVVALMLAQRASEAALVGLEINEKVSQLSEKNFAESKFSPKLTAVHSSLQDYFPKKQLFDLVVSNPPFFSSGLRSKDAARNRVRHTVDLSHDELISGAARLMDHSGRFVVILPYEAGKRFVDKAEQYEFYLRKIIRVRFTQFKPIERLILEFSRLEVSSISMEAIVLQNERGVRTPAHQKLVKNYLIGGRK